jgi:hypothetical protein
MTILYHDHSSKKHGCCSCSKGKMPCSLLLCVVVVVAAKITISSCLLLEQQLKSVHVPTGIVASYVLIKVGSVVVVLMLFCQKFLILDALLLSSSDNEGSYSATCH